MADERYEEKDQYPELINGGQVDEAIVNTPPTEKGVFNTGITATQIERVIDLPIPTTDDSGKVLKVDAEGKWELSTDAEGTVVVANPTGAATENLTKLQVEDKVYGIPNELPATTSATAGQVLSLDANKEPEWAFIQAGLQVLELASDSGTLTDEQYALVSGSNCVIKYGSNYYYKGSYATSPYTMIVYKDYSISYDSNSGNYVQKRITITNNKAYESSVFSIVGSNPALDGTETQLTSISIGNNKYKIKSGTQLYLLKLTMPYKDSNNASHTFKCSVLTNIKEDYVSTLLGNVLTNGRYYNETYDYFGIVLEDSVSRLEYAGEYYNAYFGQDKTPVVANKTFCFILDSGIRFKIRLMTPTTVNLSDGTFTSNYTDTSGTNVIPISTITYDVITL